MAISSKFSFKQKTVIPGFGISFGFTVFYLSIVVLIPLSFLVWNSFALSPTEFWEIITSPRVLHAFEVSFYTSFIAALINVFFGLIIAWVLVRYQFPFKKFIDALVDLPFALPTAVAGIALTAIYAPDGIIGKFLEQYGIKVAFTPLGIIIALVFVGIPFVVRTVQPVLEDIDREIEEAAASLGASRFITFTRVIFPILLPALLTGFSMAFARALGEYGSVIFIAGNMPNVSEILPLIIVIKLEQYDYAAATAIATVILLISFILLFVINSLQKWSMKYKDK
jgi:sulfate/thiosulfate transport system permease protein